MVTILILESFKPSNAVILNDRFILDPSSSFLSPVPQMLHPMFVSGLGSLFRASSVCI